MIIPISFIVTPGCEGAAVSIWTSWSSVSLETLWAITHEGISSYKI